MNRLFLMGALCLLSTTLLTCSKNSDNNPSGSNCGNHNGKQLYLGPDGGCYYLSSGGNKEYVERSECTCSVN